MFDQWLVVLSGPTLVEEVRKLPDDVASAARALQYVGCPFFFALPMYANSDDGPDVCLADTSGQVCASARSRKSVPHRGPKREADASAGHCASSCDGRASNDMQRDPSH